MIIPDYYRIDYRLRKVSCISSDLLEDGNYDNQFG